MTVWKSGPEPGVMTVAVPPERRARPTTRRVTNSIMTTRIAVAVVVDEGEMAVDVEEKARRWIEGEQRKQANSAFMWVHAEGKA